MDLVRAFSTFSHFWGLLSLSSSLTPSMVVAAVVVVFLLLPLHLHPLLRDCVPLSSVPAAGVWMKRQRPRESRTSHFQWEVFSEGSSSPTLVTNTPPLLPPLSTVRSEHLHFFYFTSFNTFIKSNSMLLNFTPSYPNF